MNIILRIIRKYCSRRWKIKSHFDENIKDISFTIALDNCIVQTFKTIFDQLNMSLNERFSIKKDLVADVQLFTLLVFRKNYIYI